jgi:integrase/recombinase XerD
MINVLKRYDPKKLNKDGLAQVKLFVYLNDERIRFNTGVLIKPNEWDKDKSLVRRTCKEYVEHNLTLDKQVQKINEIKFKYRLKDAVLTPDLLRLEMARPNYGFDFIDFMDRAIKERTPVQITESSARYHKRVWSKLKVYQERILSDELTSEFILKYAKYLEKKLDNSQNTIQGNIKVIKTYVQRAIDLKLLDHDAKIHNPINVVDTEIVFLTSLEYGKLVELYHKKILSNSLQSVLRWYLFSCNTGLRISDVRLITMDQIFENTLIMVPKKSKKRTNRTVRIPLMGFAQQLIRDEGEKRIENRVFNCISEQNMRDYIKLIATKHTDIKKSLNWHSSRHTYCTLFAKNTNGNLAALQTTTGHTKLQDLQKYLHLDANDVRKAMEYQDEINKENKPEK